MLIYIGSIFNPEFSYLTLSDINVNKKATEKLISRLAY